MSCDKLLLLLLNQYNFAVFHVQNVQIHHFSSYIFEAHLHEFGASDIMNIISVFMSYIGNSLFRTYKTIDLPVKSNWRSYCTFVFYSYVCRTYIQSLFIGKMSRTYLKHLAWNETYTLLSNFYHNKLNISSILKDDKLFGVQYLQRIWVIANVSIATHLLCVLNMLIFLAAT